MRQKYLHTLCECCLVTSQFPRLLFLNKFIYFYFIYFWLCWVFVAVPRLSLVVASRATLRCGARASHCGGFSCCGARAQGTQASVVGAHGLSSCGSRAQLLCGMWDLPGPGLEPVSPALAGRFLTIAPTGKPPDFFVSNFPILFLSTL